MYLHIGNGISIRDKDIIGIFDLDTSTVSQVTKKFINKKQKHYSDYIDILKFIVDLRTDVAKDKIYIPYKDRFNRVYYVEQLIW